MSDFERLMNVAADPAFRNRIGAISEEMSVPGMEAQVGADVYRAAFSTPAGRAVLGDLIERYCMVSRWYPGEPDGSGHYREGMAQVVFEIAAKVEAASQEEYTNGDEN